ncbi:post-transcriptional regulator [Edaphobacillus lindanitolerans]|uniref:Post-transcriptional regulator n=1 Tax=Edaphobacillus lindanitolerans TaxID=550447 RepID=A0A1U7PJV4_9BACI|nr:post-transcriptional regulator [Edaphobacillus lindanitolerans]SIT82889.1 Post-transcriptional regulator [Edaphobacillus lindanitolerans]
MGEALDREQFNRLKPALSSKTEEFRIYHYGSVTEEDLWAYCVKKLWRKKDPATMPLHEMVGDILSISPARYMTFSQVEGLKTASEPGAFGGLDADEFKALLAPRGPASG